jgi:hypothetical protein
MKLSLFPFITCGIFCLCLLPAAPARAAANGGSQITQGVLPPPVIVAPAEIAELRGVDHVTFRWRGVQGAVAYHLVLARDRRFKNIVENTNINATSYTFGNTNYGTYFLKISSVSAGRSEGPFSQRRSFIIVPPAPAGVSPGELPENGG